MALDQLTLEQKYKLLSEWLSDSVSDKVTYWAVVDS